MTERSSPEHSSIVVPTDLTARQLVAEVRDVFQQVGVRLAFDNETIPLIERGLVSIKGKVPTVVTHSVDGYCTTAEALALQNEGECLGNAAAFLSWVAQTKRVGMSASIINQNYAVQFLYDEFCDFLLRNTSREWPPGFLFVSFRVN